MLGSTVKHSRMLKRRRFKIETLKSTGILTCFPFDPPTFLWLGYALLVQALGPTNPKRNTLV